MICTDCPSNNRSRRTVVHPDSHSHPHHWCVIVAGAAVEPEIERGRESTRRIYNGCAVYIRFTGIHIPTHLMVIRTRGASLLRARIGGCRPPAAVVPSEHHLLVLRLLLTLSLKL